MESWLELLSRMNSITYYGVAAAVGTPVTEVATAVRTSVPVPATNLTPTVTAESDAMEAARGRPQAAVVARGPGCEEPGAEPVPPAARRPAHGLAVPEDSRPSLVQPFGVVASSVSALRQLGRLGQEVYERGAGGGRESVRRRAASTIQRAARAYALRKRVSDIARLSVMVTEANRQFAAQRSPLCMGVVDGLTVQFRWLFPCGAPGVATTATGVFHNWLDCGKAAQQIMGMALNQECRASQIYRGPDGVVAHVHTPTSYDEREKHIRGRLSRPSGTVPFYNERANPAVGEAFLIVVPGGIETTGYRYHFAAVVLKDAENNVFYTLEGMARNGPHQLSCNPLLCRYTLEPGDTFHERWRDSFTRSDGTPAPVRTFAIRPPRAMGPADGSPFSDPSQRARIVAIPAKNPNQPICTDCGVELQEYRLRLGSRYRTAFAPRGSTGYDWSL